jgi:HK97 family phage major capsid protein
MDDIASIKTMIDAQGTAWEEFKKTNDDRLAKLAKGESVADIEAKLEKIGKDLDTLAEVRAEVDKLALKANRPTAGDSDEGDIRSEAKSFNINRRAMLQNAPSRDLTTEEYQNYKSAFVTWARKGSLDRLSDNERKAMSAGDDANGGYMLPTPTVGRVVQKIFELSPIRQIASVQAISTQALEGLNDNDEASYGWVGEVAARPTTNTPTLGKYRIEAFEMYANPKTSQTLLDDAAVDVEAWLAAKVANKFARVEGSAFINGTGINQPRGFASGYTLVATGDATRTWGQIEKVKTGANGDFAAGATGPDVLFSLIQAFKSAYLNNARWVTTREVISKVRKLKEATTNAYMWQPGLAKGTPDSLLGYSIVMAQDIPALATGSASLWFGDWSEAYQIVDRMGMRTIRDNLTDKPNVQFYTTKRVGGGVLNFEAIKAITFES